MLFRAVAKNTCTDGTTIAAYRRRSRPGKGLSATDSKAGNPTQTVAQPLGQRGLARADIPGHQNEALRHRWLNSNDSRPDDNESGQSTDQTAVSTPSSTIAPAI